MTHSEKIAGIIGGMGPEATVDLMRRIINNTPAQDDADHIRCIVDNNAKVPSRIKALIEGGGENPGPVMADMGKRLEAWGADFLCIACNTAHNYYPDVKKAVSIPVLNMIEIAVDAALEQCPDADAVGILASPAVRTTRLYSDVLSARKVKAVYLSTEMESALLEVIKEVKKGRTGPATRQRLADIVAAFQGTGIGCAIAACTELGIIMDGESYPFPIIDAAEVLAKAIVSEAKKREPGFSDLKSISGSAK